MMPINMEQYFMKKNEIKNSADLFFYKAQIDLTAAKYILESFNAGKLEIDFEIIYFHLQQCTEKLLKSLVSKNKIRVLRTHDIEDLIELLEEHNIYTINNIESLERLSQYAVEGRYAIIHDDLDDVDKYIVILDELLEFVKEKISEK